MTAVSRSFPSGMPLISFFGWKSTEAVPKIPPDLVPSAASAPPEMKSLVAL